MMTTVETMERRSGPRDEEITRRFRLTALPAPVEPRPEPTKNSEIPAGYLLAPQPWPRGQFVIHPEG